MVSEGQGVVQDKSEIKQEKGLAEGLVPSVQFVSPVRLFCDPLDCSPPGSSVHGIFQERVLEQVAFPSPVDIPNPGVELGSPALAGGFFTTKTSGKPMSPYYR